MSSQPGQQPDAKRWEKLASLAGMLGSEHDGERATAARFATLELQALGLTWRELVERAQRSVIKVGAGLGGAFRDAFNWGPPPASQQPPPYSQAAWQQSEWARQANAQAYNRPPPKPRTNKRNGIKLWDLVRYALARMEELTPFEAKFVQAKHVIGKQVNATDAEWRVLLQIAAKLGIPIETEA